MDVVIPAGGTIDAHYAQVIGTPHRALAPLGPERQPVMQIVVDALRAGGAHRVIGVAPPPVAEAVAGVDLWLPSSESGPDNIRRGLEVLDPDRHALVCTSDLPLMTPDSVASFIAGCRAEADVSLGMVSARAYRAEFPEAPTSEFVALRPAGAVTLGCLFRIRPGLLMRNQAVLAHVFAARKSQWRLAHLLGPRLLWQFATKTLALRPLVARAEGILHCRADVLQDVAPVLSFDIDTADDYTYADTRLRHNRTHAPLA